MPLGAIQIDAESLPPKMSSKGSKSYRVNRSGGSKLLNSSFVRNSKIVEQAEQARIRHMRIKAGKRISLISIYFSFTRTPARPRVSQETFQDIDIDYVDDSQVPQEPLPTDFPLGDGDSQSDEDHEDELFQHFLEHNDARRGRRAYKTKPGISYRTRLERERLNWTEIEDSLTRAYMAFKAEGPEVEPENEQLSEGSERFSCEVITLQGEHISFQCSIRC
jgi:hypothetical protein